MSDIEKDLDTTLKEAKRNLNLWLKDKGYVQRTNRDWNRWTYGDCHFWSVFVWALHHETFAAPILGMQIYDNGRVICVSHNPNSEMY